MSAGSWIALATAGCFVASSCSLFDGPVGNDSSIALEAASRELFQILDGLDRSAVQEVRLLTIARRIASDARLLIDEQTAFLSDFDRLSRRADVSDSDLLELVDAFAVRRVRVRDELFGLQDQLRAELSTDEWAKVVVALNTKAHVARINLYEA